MDLSDLDQLINGDDGSGVGPRVDCPVCNGVDLACERCDGRGTVLISSLDDDERFAAGLLWEAQLPTFSDLEEHEIENTYSLPSVDGDPEESDHPDGFLDD